MRQKAPWQSPNTETIKEMFINILNKLILCILTWHIIVTGKIIQMYLNLTNDSDSLIFLVAKTSTSIASCTW